MRGSSTGGRGARNHQEAVSQAVSKVRCRPTQRFERKVDGADGVCESRARTARWPCKRPRRSGRGIRCLRVKQFLFCEALTRRPVFLGRRLSLLSCVDRGSSTPILQILPGRRSCHDGLILLSICFEKLPSRGRPEGRAGSSSTRSGEESASRMRAAVRAAFSRTEEEAGTARAIDAMRDAEQHGHATFSEGLVYAHARAGVTLFEFLSS